MEAAVCSTPYSLCTWSLKFWSSHHLDRPPDRLPQAPLFLHSPADKVSRMPTCCSSTSLTLTPLVENPSKMYSAESPKVVIQHLDAHICKGSIQEVDVGWHLLSLEHALASLEQAPLLLPSFENCISIIVKCRNEKNLACAFRLHVCICIHGLEAHRMIADYLISMWVEVGSIHNARTIFDQQQPTTAYSWNFLIKGYIKSGDMRHALILYHNMLDSSLLPNEPTWVALLKACATLKDLHTGSELHAKILSDGCVRTLPFVGSSLVDMYAKCGALEKAQEVFDMLPVRDVVAWTALIGGYAQHERGAEALDCYQQMQLGGLSPNSFTFVCSLRACGSLGASGSLEAIDKGKEIHAHIEKTGLLKSNLFVGNALVDMYARCGFLQKAQEVFDKLPNRDVVSWTTLILGYTNQDDCKEALKCFNQMQSEGVRADAVTYSCILKACGSLRDLDKGRQIHAKIVNEGLLKSKNNLSISNALIDMYAKCNVLDKAQEVFDNLAHHNVVSWNTLIAGYVLNDCCEEALEHYKLMQHTSISPNVITYACILRACGRIGDTELGKEIHSEIARNGFLQKDLTLGNALIDMYAKCGLLEKAQDVFDQLSVCNVISWNTLIAAYAQHECGEEAVYCLQRMQQEDVSPDAFSFASSLKACGSIKLVDQGREVHSDIIKKGLLNNNLVIGNALVDLYAKCGLLAEAQEVFNKLSVPDVISWTTLILGYVDTQCNEEALNTFKYMQSTHVSPNSVTLACSLKACGSIGARDMGREIHVEIARRNLLEGDPMLGSMLIDMYAEIGLLKEAQEVFDTLPVCDVVSWTALIANYDEHGHSEEALSLFKQMQMVGIIPNIFTFSCSLKACGNAGALTMGKEIHTVVESKGLLQDNLILGTALVDMYAKSGLLEEALAVFDKIQAEDMVLWNTLITGYAQLGDIESVLGIYDTIRESNKPDTITFLNILSACSHAGLVDEAQVYFETMNKDYGITPTLEHYTCLIDLFGRAGQLDRVVPIMMATPFSLNVTMWLALLGACRKWSNVEIGVVAFHRAVALGGFGAAVYVCMHNIYADMNVDDGAWLEDASVDMEEGTWLEILKRG